MHIRITDFAGTFPKLHPTKLPDIAAQSCLNVMLEHGTLESIREATTYNESNGFPYADFKSAMFFTHGADKYKKFSNQIVSYAFSPVHDSYRLYWTTEDANQPLLFSDWDIQPNGTLASDNYDYKAGMPPIDAEKITITGLTELVPDPVKPPTDPTAPVPPVVAPKETAVISPNKSIFALATDAIKSASGAKPLTDELDESVAAALEVPEARDARIYAFTYVNKFGDESAPSVKEVVYYINKDDKPIITIPYAAGVRADLVRDYGISAIRLYRSVSDGVGGAQFLFVKEIPFSLLNDAIVATDDLPKGSLQLGEVLPTVNYDPPRRGMRGLGVTDYGIGYAYIEKTICLTEPYLLYAWPRFYELSTQHTIMGMGHYDNSIVVATTGNPVLINGVDPDAMNAMTLPLYEGCVSSRSMVNLNHGCMYASNNGLVLVTTNSAKLLTEETISADDWQKINPASIHACAYKGGYLFFWKTAVGQGSGYIDLNSPNKGVLWFDEYTINTFLDDGILQMVSSKPNGAGVVRSIHSAFNPDYGQPYVNKRYQWRSKTFNLDLPKRFLAGQVVADHYPTDDILIMVYADGALIHESVVKDGKPFRIKNHSAKRDFSIELRASVAIREVALGETMRDMLI